MRIASWVVGGMATRVELYSYTDFTLLRHR